MVTGPVMDDLDVVDGRFTTGGFAVCDTLAIVSWIKAVIGNILQPVYVVP